jgi:hypothetical protein
MKRFRLISLLFILVTLLAVAIPASAITSAVGAPRIPVTQSTSSNWSGYAVETNLTNPASGVVTDVKGQWTVPTVSSSKGSTYSSVWVGIDGYSDSTVEQIGTEQDWTGGAVYYAWYEMYPNASYRIPNAISPGDVMVGEVQYNSGKFILTLTDSTKGWTFSITQTSSSALRQSAEWVVEAPWLGRVLPLANFGTVVFTGASATINSTTGTISSWPYDPITMVDGKATATPSGLSSGGSSFSVTYGSSSSQGNGGHGNSHNNK